MAEKGTQLQGQINTHTVQTQSRAFLVAFRTEHFCSLVLYSHINILFFGQSKYPLTSGVLTICLVCEEWE